MALAIGTDVGGAVSSPVGTFISRLLGGGSAGFSPTDISGCVLHLDASDSSTYTISTGVSEWRDQSDEGNDVTQGTGSQQPTISSAWQNGLDGIRWTAASSQSLNLTSGFSGIASSDYAQLFVVGDMPAADQVMLSLENAGGVMALLANGSDPQARFNTTGDSNERASWSTGVGSAVRIWEILVAATDTVGEILADDVSRGTGDPGSPATGGFASDGDSLHLGSWGFGGGYYNGTMGEIILYQNASTGGISTDDRTELMTHLSDKWNIAI